MDFLKKHYEKILLGLVLAGLVGALVFMPFYISQDNAALAALTDTIINPSVKELPGLDLSSQTAVAARLRAPYNLNLETTNKVFNPMEWQKSSDGNLVPIATRIGSRMIVVANITPLYLVITLDSITTNEIGVRYCFGVEKQAEKIPAKRRKVPRFFSVGDKANEFFSVIGIKGAPENPDEISIKLADSGEVVSLSHDRTFRRVDAYAADFRYDPERKIFRAKRAGDKVSFNGTDFIVDDVNQNELILQDQSNQKKTSLPFTP